MCRSEFADQRFARSACSRAECSPDAEVDILIDRPRGTIHEKRLHNARVIAARRDRRVRSGRQAGAFLPRVVIHVVRPAVGVQVADDCVRTKHGREAFVMDATIAPFGVAGVVVRVRTELEV